VIAATAQPVAGHGVSVLGLLVFGLIIWGACVAVGVAPSPVLLWRSFRQDRTGQDTGQDTGHENPRSDTVSGPEEADDDVRTDEGTLDQEMQRLQQEGIVLVSHEDRRRYAWGPLPQLVEAFSGDEAEAAPEAEAPAGPAPKVASVTHLGTASTGARRAWVRRELSAGRNPAAVDRMGAAKWGVSEKTISRDRAHLARKAQEGK
jgi:hypothetical protein